MTRRSSQAALTQPRPWLEHLTVGESQGYPIDLDQLPFRLGRSKDADFVLPYPQVSRLHAVIYEARGRFFIRDLGSANGTFVNGRRVNDTELKDGAIIHLACREYRFHAQAQTGAEGDPSQTFTVADLGLYHGRPLLEELLRQRSVLALFQPIVELASGYPFGYEALGRGTHNELSARPLDLFRVADQYQMAGELSRLFRAVAVAEARLLPRRPALFCNIHPSELADPRFLESLADLRRRLPDGQVLVLEIHEDTVADLEPLQRLREDLRRLDILLAYDDFGAGQARLAELAEVPPDFVKLNITLIRGIEASVQRQRLVKAIVDMARDVGSRVIAEGIETDAELAMCRALGCELGQGYRLGYPQRVSASGEEVDTAKVEIVITPEKNLYPRA